jgi:hypothetical protein
LYKEQNPEHKTYGRRIVTQAKKNVEASLHFTKENTFFYASLFSKAFF